MEKIKISMYPEGPLFRQTPGYKGIWKGNQFLLNEGTEVNCWTVYDSINSIEKTICIKGKSILITGEPPSVKKYNRNFLKQFDIIITCHRNIQHDNVVFYQQALPWHVGRKQDNNKSISFTKSYDELISMLPVEKTKKISLIASDKKNTPGHLLRYKFVMELKKKFNSDIDVYGRGFNEIDDKWNAIAPYKYHIVLENSSYEDYWTEKLSDAYLGFSYPIYYGCLNLNKYFIDKAYSSIDINDFNAAFKTIENILNNDFYNERLNDIIEARDLILNKYNIFPMLCEMCSIESVSNKKILKTIKPEFLFDMNLTKKIKYYLRKYL